MAGKVETFENFCLGKRRKVPGCPTSSLTRYFVLIEEKATAAGNKVSTLNSDIFVWMATPPKETYLNYKFHQLYPNILDSEVILALFNHGSHWCLVVVNLKENFSVYLDSSHEGAGAKMAFSRVNNFLTSCASINGINAWTWRTGSIL